MVLNMGRPKGRNFQQFKIYLTTQQIKWFQSRFCPNASKLIRQLIDTNMNSTLRELEEQFEQCEAKLEELNLEIEQLKGTVALDAPTKIWSLRKTIDEITNKRDYIKFEIESLKKCLTQ
jgi:uncharacterized coiled-coil DUF342 family protein